MSPDIYLCDGCNVRHPFEHRCHGEESQRPCECEDCREEREWLASRSGGAA